MKILVTGGAGFIGSNIVDAYIEKGHQVTIVDDLSSGKKANINPKAKFLRINIQAPKLRDVFKKGKFDVVNHHAAQIDVRKSIADPAFDAKVNVLGLLNILEACRETKVKKIIFSASGGTYYGECSKPAPETNAPEPASAYGITKLAGESYIKMYGALHGLKYTVFRYGNVYGPRQDPHGEAGVVAIFSQGMLKEKPLFIFGDGGQERDYVFVKDVVKANVRALRFGHNNVFNIGTGKATSVNKLFGHIQKVTGYENPAILKPARPGELQRSVLSIKKAEKEFSWKPGHSLQEGLRETVKYFRKK